MLLIMSTYPFCLLFLIKYDYQHLKFDYIENHTYTMASNCMTTRNVEEFLLDFSFNAGPEAVATEKEKKKI